MWFNSSKKIKRKKKESEPFFYCYWLFFSSPNWKFFFLFSFPSLLVRSPLLHCKIINERRLMGAGKRRAKWIFIVFLFFSCTTCCLLFSFQPSHTPVLAHLSCAKQQKLSSVKGKNAMVFFVPFFFFSFIWRRFIVLWWWSIIHFGGSKTQMELRFILFLFDWLMKKCWKWQMIKSREIASFQWGPNLLDRRRIYRTNMRCLPTCIQY